MTLKLTESRGHPVLEDRWDLLHRHALGRAGEAFLRGLDRRELVVATCPSCKRTLLPPRGFCERCFEATELAPFPGRRGELLTFTVNRLEFTDAPQVPFAIGYVRLAGADTALGALIEGVDLEPEVGDPPLSVGMEMELAIDPGREGADKLRFHPLEGW